MNFLELIGGEEEHRKCYITSFFKYYFTWLLNVIIKYGNCTIKNLDLEQNYSNDQANLTL